MREHEREREGGKGAFIPGLVYTSRKSRAAMEKSAKVGRSLGFTSGMLIFASWSS